LSPLVINDRFAHDPLRVDIFGNVNRGRILIPKGLPSNKMEKDTIPRGLEILYSPRLNKGTAFTERERDALGLRGLLPPRVHTQDEQVDRVLGNIRKKPTDIERYIFLVALQVRNEKLFYRVLTEHIDEMMPLIYTPTVGQACQEYGHIFRRPQGLFISATDRGRVGEVLRNWPHPGVRVIVVTDGERILGLGDLGADGMGIPVGKLALYTACGGIDPAVCLPVTIDVGTENEALLADALYIGLRHRRLRGPPYDELIEEFVIAVEEIFPGALIQLEDFANRNAFRLLEKYRNRVCCFDDDIQGTAAVALAGLCAALRITGGLLRDHRILFFGAGEAGIGIADLVVAALTNEGCNESEARARCWFLDSKGLIVNSRSDLASHKAAFAHDHPPVANPLAAIEALHPTALIGVSGHAGTFSKEVVEAVARINERPIIFALSNPTAMSECTAEQAYTWTDGRCVFASGSPFGPVTFSGKTFFPGQGNNAYVFPGVGLGVLASGSRFITNEMFLAAAGALAGEVTESDLAAGRVYPPLNRIREVSAKIAFAVADLAHRRGLAPGPTPSDLAQRIERLVYQPDYVEYA
jgi:malate dehydrogenase (oxaloacetate-decarboxylating)(NADP+)